MVFLLLAQAFWFVAPAYAANGFPPLMCGKKPVDCERKWRGKRLLGEGKTVEGTVGGILFGILFAALQVAIQSRFPELAPLGLTEMTLETGAALSIGALLGDLGGSFVKRRLDVKRGDSALLLDQLGFLFAALVLAYAINPFHPLIALTLVLLTPPIHMLSNILGYHMRLKKHPW